MNTETINIILIIFSYIITYSCFWCGGWIIGKKKFTEGIVLLALGTILLILINKIILK